MPTAAKDHNIRPELERLAVPIDSVQPHPRNPRKGNVDGIAESLDRFGQMRPILVQKATNYVVAGNHTRYAAQKRGWTHIAAVVMDMDDDTALSYLLADNRWSDIATNDDAALLAILHELEIEGQLDGTGYSEFDVDELEALLAELGDPDDPDADPGRSDDDEPKGSKLELVDVTVRDPDTQLSEGSIVSLGDHRLIVASVYTGWPLWGKLLDDDTLFVPYPTPTLLLTERAQRTRLVLVQPDPYLAGHLVDKYVSVFGRDGVSVA